MIRKNVDTGWKKYIMLRDDDGYYWYHTKSDKAIRVTVTDTELHAYQTVAKYGKFAKAGIRM